MRSILFISTIFLLIISFSCQKNITTKENLVNTTASDKIAQDQSLNSVVSSAHWYANYIDPVCTSGDGMCDPDATEIFESDLIKNGVAQVPFLSGYTFSYSNISFDIPSDYNISGDSLVFQTVVENPVINNIADCDVLLQIAGSQHSAQLHFVADASVQQNNQYYIGSQAYNNLPQLVHYFGSFETIKWVMKKDGTAAYINGKLKYKFNYGASNRIGRVQTITVAGKGYVAVNSVKLLHSYTNKKILVENFNIDGQSHTIFY